MSERTRLHVTYIPEETREVGTDIKIRLAEFSVSELSRDTLMAAIGGLVAGLPDERMVIECWLLREWKEPAATRPTPGAAAEVGDE